MPVGPRLPQPVIQLNPPGLLDLLGLKSFGENPPLLGGVVTPTFDLADYYLRSKFETNSSSTNWTTSASVAIVDFAVPNGEWWWVQRLTHTWLTVTGDLLRYGAPLMTINGRGFIMGESVAAAVAAFDQFQFTRCETVPFWAPPGSSLGSLHGGTNTSTTSNVAASILFTRVRV
jgi:hypothetical protein